MTGLPTIQPAKSVEYTTPEDLFDQWWEEVGGFDMDPFCRAHHHTARRVLENGGTICIPPEGVGYRNPQIEVNGLAHPWHGKVFMNPPYGPFLRQCIPYAVHQVECGNAELVMALLPTKTEVRWFQEYVLQRVRFGQRRVRKHGMATHREWTARTHDLVADVRFLGGRLYFGGGEGPARVGNVLVVWRK